MDQNQFTTDHQHLTHGKNLLEEVRQSLRTRKEQMEKIRADLAVSRKKNEMEQEKLEREVESLVNEMDAATIDLIKVVGRKV